MRSEQDVGYVSSLGWFWRWWKASEGISVNLILVIYWFLNLFILIVLFTRTLIFKTEEFMVRIDHIKHGHQPTSISILTLQLVDQLNTWWSRLQTHHHTNELILETLPRWSRCNAYRSHLIIFGDVNLISINSIQKLNRDNVTLNIWQIELLPQQKGVEFLLVRQMLIDMSAQISHQFKNKSYLER